MKKIVNYIIIILITINFYPLIVSANIVCNDGTISTGCSDCHRGCCSRHGGCTSNPNSSSGSSSNNNSSSSNNSSSGNSSSSNNSNPVTENVKSSDATLKNVTVDDQNIPISNNMEYTTQNEKVTISAIANDAKAKVDYQQNPDLKIGDNNIDITVTAENGQTKKYTLNIIRESKVINIKIFVDEKEITFDSFKSEMINISNDRNDVAIKYEIDDKDSKVEITGNENLKVGYNEIIVKVIPKDGTEQDYIIRVNKEETLEENNAEAQDENTTTNNSEESDTEETDSNIIGSLLFVGGTGALIYYFVKGKK